MPSLIKDLLPRRISEPNHKWGNLVCTGEGRVIRKV